MAKSSFVERNKAVREAWNREIELVQEGKGTREWTPEQQKDILEKGRAYDDKGKAFEGQHMKSAEQYPEYQGDSGNIQFLTRAEHLEAHNGNWQNPTNWYYNPVTKEMYDFGEGPYIPCEIIQLSAPVIEIHVNKEKEVNQESAKILQVDDIQSDSQSKNMNVKQSNLINKQDVGLSRKLKSGIKSLAKSIMEFPSKHPTATKVIKGVGIFAAVVAAEVAVESAKGSSANSRNDHSFDQRFVKFGEFSGL